MTIKKIYAAEEDCRYKGLIGYWDTTDKMFHLTVTYNDGQFSPEGFIKSRMENESSEDLLIAAVTQQVPIIKTLFKDFMKTCKSKYKKGQKISFTSRFLRGQHQPPQLGTLKSFQGFKLVCSTNRKKTRIVEMWKLIDSIGHEENTNSDHISSLGDFDKWHEGKKIALEAKRKIKAAGCRGFHVVYDGKVYTVK